MNPIQVAMSDLIPVVLDVEDIRFKKVLEEVPLYRVKKTGKGTFSVKKGDREYHVDLAKEEGVGLKASCDCPDWSFHARKLGVPCKHVWLAAKEDGLVSFPRFDPIAGPVPIDIERNKKADGDGGGP
jgi:hypothetical protein